MSQTWTDNPYQLDHTGTTDLQAIENNLLTLKSLFSGASTPSNNVAGMPWFDTTNKLLKIRNNANSAWLGVLYGPATLKTWIYANAATDGWAIDAAVTDVVLSLKGGSQAYNANGGTQAGTWTQPNHTLIEAEIPTHDHDAVGNHNHSVTRTTSGGGGFTGSVSPPVNTGLYSNFNTGSDGGHTHDEFGGDGAHNHGTTHRPLAAIGTLQYPDV